jgi:hypothetical protein
MEVRAFPVRLPSGVRYWTVLDDDLAPVPQVDAFLRQVRFGRCGLQMHAADQRDRTFSAWGPFWPRVISNSTF